MEENVFFQIEFLDGSQDGWISCKPNSSRRGLIAFRIPKDKIDLHSQIEQLANSGIYILLGRDEKNRDAAYIGQVQRRQDEKSFLDRFSEHKNAKKFWNEAIVFTTTATDSQNIYNDTDLNYLERTFIQEADKGIFVVTNSKKPDPNRVSINRADRYDCDCDFETAKFLISALGCDIFRQDNLPEQIGQREEKTKKKESKINASKIGKPEIIKICKECNCTINIDNLNKATNGKDLIAYYINPYYESLDSDWTLVLNDTVNEIIYIFNIKGREIERSQLKPKKSDPTRMEIRIRYNDPKFTDMATQYEFKKYMVAAIQYRNGELKILEEIPIADINGPKVQKTKKSKTNKNVAKKPINFVVNGLNFNVYSWIGILQTTIEYLVALDPKPLCQLAEEKTIISHKSKKPTICLTLNPDDISRDKKAIQAEGKTIYYLSNLSSGQIKSFITEILLPKYKINVNSFKITEVEIKKIK